MCVASISRERWISRFVVLLKLIVLVSINVYWWDKYNNWKMVLQNQMDNKTIKKIHTKYKKKKNMLKFYLNKMSSENELPAILLTTFSCWYHFFFLVDIHYTQYTTSITFNNSLNITYYIALSGIIALQQQQNIKWISIKKCVFYFYFVCVMIVEKIIWIISYVDIYHLVNGDVFNESGNFIGYACGKDEVLQ